MGLVRSSQHPLQLHSQGSTSSNLAHPGAPTPHLPPVHLAPRINMKQYWVFPFLCPYQREKHWWHSWLYHICHSGIWISEAKSIDDVHSLCILCLRGVQLHLGCNSSFQELLSGSQHSTHGLRVPVLFEMQFIYSGSTENDLGVYAPFCFDPKQLGGTSFFRPLRHLLWRVPLSYRKGVFFLI